MKITPLEIRQKTFEKAFRGLDKDEVTAFLTTLSTEWEKLMDENKELQIKLEASQREVEKLREVENSLFKTLKTAEDTGANMIDQANKAAELHMRETEMKAEALMSDAKNKARDMIEDAESKSRHAVEDMEEKLRNLAHLYKNLENVKDDLISDIKTYASEAIEKASRVKNQIKTIDIDEEMLKLKRSISDTPVKAKKEEEPEKEAPVVYKKASEKTAAKPEKPQDNLQEVADDSKSFFDDID